MFYKFAKVVITIMLRLFFRRIYVSGTEHISSKKPQLLASNHPNGFIEPLVMACFFPKPLYFLVRGDVFDNALIRPILRATNQIPIFRFRDGFSRLRENTGTMEESIQVLLENKNLLIFAEGGTESIKKLRPLQKGIARIAFQVLEKNPQLPLEILPVGVNFTYPSRFGEEVMIRIGPPIQATDYYPLYLEDKNKAVDLLLSDIYKQIKPQVIHLEDQHRIHVFEKLAILTRNLFSDPYFFFLSKNDVRLQTEKNLAESVDALSEHDLEGIRKDIRDLEGSLKQHRLDDSFFTKAKITWVKGFLLILLGLPALAGYLLHIVPLLGAKKFTNSKVKHREFVLSILLVATLVLTTVSYFIYLVFFSMYHLPFTWFLAIPALGFCTFSVKLIWRSVHFRSQNTMNEIHTHAKKVLQYVS